MSDAERTRRYRARQRGEVEGNEARRPGRKPRSRADAVLELLWSLRDAIGELGVEEVEDVVQHAVSWFVLDLPPTTTTSERHMAVAGRADVVTEQWLGVFLRDV
jgi:hypothetical protein